MKELLMFSNELNLAVSPESIHQYKEIAYKHLHEHNSTVGVAFAGLDEEGNEIFGIRLVSDDGEEEWYDSEGGSHILTGWNDEIDAYTELENNVLPQIGYAVSQKDLHAEWQFIPLACPRG